MRFTPRAVAFIIGRAWRRLSLALLLLPGLALGYGELMVHPTRIVLEPGEHSAQLEVINNGAETVTYRVALVNKRMTEDGQFEPVPEGEPGYYADPFVRYTPRQFTLAPGTSQIVRLLARLPADAETGEYRSHLSIRALPPARLPGTAQPGQGFSVQLTPIYGVSLPVILRHSGLSAQVGLGGLEFREAPASSQHAGGLLVRLTRDGSRSVYGNVTVFFTPDGGDEQVIGRANGVAVYTPNRVRTLEVPLTLAPEKLQGGSLRVLYRQKEEDGGGVWLDQRFNIQ